jgi:Flp pilus assembly protein TadD
MAEEAIEQLRNVLLLKPEFVPALLDLGRAYVEQSAFDEAIEALSKANALAKNHPHILGTLGHCYAVMGKEKEARKIARDLGRRSAESASPSLALARVHAGLGDTDEAFRSMEQAVADRAARIIEIGVDPMFASLREDPRFRKIREEICLETPPKGRMKSGAAPSTSSPG